MEIAKARFDKMVLGEAEKVLREIEGLARKRFLPIVGSRGKILVKVVRGQT